MTGDAQATALFANRAAALDPDSDVVINNLIHSGYLVGDLDSSLAMADRLAELAKSDLMREVGRAAAEMLRASIDGSLEDAKRHLSEFADRSRRLGHPHFEGVSLLNEALMIRAQGDGRAMLTTATKAIDALAASSSGNELASARFAKAWALALIGDLEASRALMVSTGNGLRNVTRGEYLVELSDIEAMFGDAERAQLLITEYWTSDQQLPLARLAKTIESQLLVRAGRPNHALGLLSSLGRQPPTAEAGALSRVMALRAIAAVAAADAGASRMAIAAIAHAEKQQAFLWRDLASVASASASGKLSEAISSIHPQRVAVISMAAELAIDGLSELTDEAMSIVAEEAALRPQRWRRPLREALEARGGASRLPAARLLDLIGDTSDIRPLRLIAKEPRRSTGDRRLGKGLAKRLAPRVIVEDLGRVAVRIGSVVIAGGEIRRKVLALLCFLASRPRLEATREEVMEALWPDMNPDAALNSLNQTIYFLRRIFEPAYEEDSSAGYLRQESDVVWLDPDLVTSRSRTCAGLMAQLETEASPELVRALSDEYVGRFALDFSYDDWATDYRDWLHIAYLRAIEGAVQSDMASGHFARGIALARRALEVDPRLDALELSLVRLLKGAGAHSAAAEQYQRYAEIQKRDFGVDAPGLDGL
jgi:DNA-binding SARP family transcriptional activator